MYARSDIYPDLSNPLRKSRFSEWVYPLLKMAYFDKKTRDRTDSQRPATWTQIFDRVLSGSEIPETRDRMDLKPVKKVRFPEWVYPLLKPTPAE